MIYNGIDGTPRAELHGHPIHTYTTLVHVQSSTHAYNRIQSIYIHHIHRIIHTYIYTVKNFFTQAEKRLSTVFFFLKPRIRTLRDLKRENLQ